MHLRKWQIPPLSEHVPTHIPPEFLLGGPVIIRCDNKAALSLCKDRKEGQRVEHIYVIHHFARDHVASGEILLCLLQV
jgi:hypothetical protein